MSDVAEVKTFDWGSKGRVTSGINVSTPKNLTPRRVQRITKKKAVIAVFQVTKMVTCLKKVNVKSMMKLNYAKFL